MRADATCLTHSSRAISAYHLLVVHLDNWSKLRRKLNLVRSGLEESQAGCSNFGAPKNSLRPCHYRFVQMRKPNMKSMESRLFCVKLVQRTSNQMDSKMLRDKAQNSQFLRPNKIHKTSMTFNSKFSFSSLTALQVSCGVLLQAAG